MTYLPPAAACGVGGGGGGNRTHGPKLFVRIIFLRNTRERCANESIMRKFVRSENEVGLGASTVAF